MASKSGKPYYVPSLWASPKNNGKTTAVKVNAAKFFRDIISDILKLKGRRKNYNIPLSKITGNNYGGGNWTYSSSVYNIFPRLTTAYDHDRDGKIGGSKGDTTIGVSGYRETGTLLKTIAILPYLKELGINVIHLFPITSIGKDGNKGDLGSPYAIKDPYSLDENLADPMIPFTVEEQFSAFVEAAHILGMRVVMEFALRTASLDSDWIKTNPEWFYWINSSDLDAYGMPIFPYHEMVEIKKIPHGGGFHFAPNKKYRATFKKPPSPKEVTNVNGKFIANTDEGELVVASAFADWPPDDKQPAWKDITYLRMYNYDFDYDGNDYNYIAYNTIRYYDPELSSTHNINRPLWKKLTGIIPHYQKLGIDGVMVDMGHALPKKLMYEIIETARKIDPDFAFIEENFDLQWENKEIGYNGSLGSMWEASAKQGGIKEIIESTCNKLPFPFFGTAETHNTPRAMQRGGELHSKQMWVVSSFLPNCIPFIHSGFELMEENPINTGLGFTEKELKTIKKTSLALFYKKSFQWDKKNNLIKFIKKINLLRDKHKDFIATGNETSIRMLHTECNYNHVTAFERIDPWQQWKSILIIANTNYKHTERFYLKVDGTNSKVYKDYISGKDIIFINNWMTFDLSPGQCLLLEIDKR